MFIRFEDLKRLMIEIGKNGCKSNSNLVAIFSLFQLLNSSCNTILLYYFTGTFNSNRFTQEIKRWETGKYL